MMGLPPKDCSYSLVRSTVLESEMELMGLLPHLTLLVTGDLDDWQDQVSHNNLAAVWHFYDCLNYTSNCDDNLSIDSRTGWLGS